MRKASGFGVLMLLVVVAIVLLLVSRDAKRLAPHAAAVREVSRTRADPAATPDGNTARPSTRLSEMEQKTDDHTRAVNDALKSVD